MVIPFTLTKENNISVEALLDGEYPVQMMFHTAVTSASVTSDFTERVGLKLDKSESVESWGGANTARYGSGHTLEIGDLQWDELTIHEGKLSGKDTEGKFGWNLFEDKILRLDFETNKLELYSELPSVDEYKKGRLSIDNGMMFVDVELTIDSEVLTKSFLIHTGFGGAIVLDDEFVAECKILEQLPVVGRKELRDSYGNVFVTKRVELPAVAVFGTRFSEVPVSIFDGAIGNQKISVLGGDLLKRFHIVFDFGNQLVYLKPNSLVSVGYKS